METSVVRKIPFGKPIVGPEEKQAVSDVLSGPILVHGPRAKEFEEAFAAYTGADYAVAVASCTAALHLSYFNLGLGAGDEVIVPAQTHTATAHAVELCGARPVFVDAEAETGNIDVEQIESGITERTRALSIVHFLGMPVDMDGINGIARKHGLFVVEDCALAIGTYFKQVHAGLHGDVGCFSFYPVKHMTTAEGGMLITKDGDIAEKINRQKAFGQDIFVGQRKVPGQYDVTMLGFNYRLNEIQSALGIEQLKRVDGFCKKRKANYAKLSRQLQNIDEISQLQSSHGEYQSSYYCLSIILNGNLADSRIEIINRLGRMGVGTSIYYPRPVPHLSYYKNKYGYAYTSFPVAARLSAASIALPVGPHLNEDDMEYIAEALKDVISEVK
ncbi:MAG TPA: DegT/DnrJ/EryC1/StrS family aminotransferase [Planctomycetes bacterium]|nr:DegT/DnrJ/EryC1/StrS family aminotransferase [Planctomycetota bacterium]